MRERVATAFAQLGRRELLKGDAFIDDCWLSGDARAAVLDPAVQCSIADVAQCSADDMTRAVEAAERSWAAWKALTPRQRGNYLLRWSAALRANARDIAVILTAEQGKPLKEALAEIAYAADFLDWFAAEGERAYAETFPSHKAGSQTIVTVHPVGVVAAVTPWNFPVAMITRKAGAALAAGCPVIVKPAQETSLSALALATLAAECGLPRGVFQVVTGDPSEIVSRALGDTRVRALSFTGSTAIGRLLLQQSAPTVKRVSMELGGHAPFIVFDDADLEHAIDGAMEAKFTTSGQDCLAANRIYVQRPLYERAVETMAEKISRLKMGHGLADGTDIGPMTRKSIADNCRTQIADALERGAKRAVPHRMDETAGGNFVQPTLLVDVADDAIIAREETFGPVAAMLPFDDEAEVLARANATEMGLAAYVYTKDLGRAMRASGSLEYGMVGVNTASFTGAPVPFGGWKQSGLGREGSRHGLSEFTELKYVCFGNLAG